MERKYYKILIVFILVIFVLVVKLVPPIIDEYEAKGNIEPIYVRKLFKSEVDEIVQEIKKNGNAFPEEVKKKYFVGDTYVYPSIFSTAYGNQIEKSASDPYILDIMASTKISNKEIKIYNVNVYEKNYLFGKRKIISFNQEKLLKIDYIINGRYTGISNYSSNLDVSKFYIRPLIITFDVSAELDGEIVTKSMEYIMKPVVEKGIQKPIWMYQ